MRAINGDNGEPWFNASDVCDVLGYANPHKTVGDHVDCDDLTKREVIDTLGRTQQTSHINDVWFVFTDTWQQKTEAKRFKRLVATEVLPSIRKTGSYTKSETTVKPSLVQPAKELRAT